MHEYPYSVTLIIPIALQETANRLACAHGHDRASLPGRTFVVELADSAAAEVTTHALCRFNAGPDFVGLFRAAKSGKLPRAPLAGGTWADYGLLASDQAAVIAALDVDIAEHDQAEAAALGARYIPAKDGGVKHWQDRIAEMGKVRVEVSLAAQLVKVEARQ